MNRFILCCQGTRLGAPEAPGASWRALARPRRAMCLGRASGARLACLPGAVQARLNPFLGLRIESALPARLPIPVPDSSALLLSSRRSRHRSSFQSPVSIPLGFYTRRRVGDAKEALAGPVLLSGVTETPASSHLLFSFLIKNHNFSLDAFTFLIGAVNNSSAISKSCSLLLEIGPFDDNNEWLMGRMEEDNDVEVEAERKDLVFDDELLTWGTIFSATRVEEEIYRTRLSKGKNVIPTKTLEKRSISKMKNPTPLVIREATTPLIIREANTHQFLEMLMMSMKRKLNTTKKKKIITIVKKMMKT
ncbi:hypothetical protein KSP39_PZI017416 [Platanthera zijinensis]|uniref:Uncharacterized protein n=1 Tax=Platanthera zijinensis TaxID=2320716 RepID=A0AAP0B617_9ASPA